MDRHLGGTYSTYRCSVTLFGTQVVLGCCIDQGDLSFNNTKEGCLVVKEFCPRHDHSNIIKTQHCIRPQCIQVCHNQGLEMHWLGTAANIQHVAVLPTIAPVGPPYAWS